MPLSRYQIRNEYSLADPELYRAADKDDPEALLEGVAMAGLVGVLRQLGDLAEFAAEIFHDLHEEVMATAARGHGLMVRVQQLEVEFPSIEKAFLSQTNHSQFISNPGVEWHPNLHADQNLITQGDLPRFIMDSYEECRGPPRLFLLDKFDVAGAGACLKRYTDPSFYKVETSTDGMTNAEVQRERKARKTKKKGSRWRKGETPEALPTSHVKLQQLFLEERIENGISDPARLVKLKRRLNVSPFDSKTGKSYMEKIINIPSAEDKLVHEISIGSPASRLPSNITSESGLETIEISAEKSVLVNSRPFSSPDIEKDVLKSSKDDFTNEKEIAVDGERKADANGDDYQYDDFASEMDNYMDALTTMESEIETDIEVRAKTDTGFFKIEKQGADYDANEEQLQAQFSDSQSIGHSTASDDGNSSSKKGISSFSYSDTGSTSAENTPDDGDDVSADVSPTENYEAGTTDMSSDQVSSTEEIVVIQTCHTDSAPTYLPVDEGAISTQRTLEERESDDQFDSGLVDAEEKATNVDGNFPFTSKLSDVPLQTYDDSPNPESAIDQSVIDKVDEKDSNVLSSELTCFKSIVEVAPEKGSGEVLLDNVVQTEHAEDGATISSVADEPPFVPALSEFETCRPDVTTGTIVSADGVGLSGGKIEVNSSEAEDTPNITEQHISEIADSVYPLEPDSADTKETEVIESETAVEAIAVSVPDIDDAKEDGSNSRSANFTDLQEECVSSVEESDQKGLEIDETRIEQNLKEPGTLKEDNQQAISPESNSVTSSDYSKSELLNNVPDDHSHSEVLNDYILDSPQTAEAEHTLHPNDAIAVPSYSENSYQDSDLQSLKLNDLIEDAEDTLSSPTNSFPEQEVDIRADRMELPHPVEGSPDSSSQLEKPQSPQCMDEERPVDAEDAEDALSSLTHSIAEQEANIHADHMELTHAVEESPDSSSQLEKPKSPQHMDEERSGYAYSEEKVELQVNEQFEEMQQTRNHTDNEICFDASPEFSSADHTSEASVPELFTRAVSHKLDISEQVTEKPLRSALPVFGLVPVVSEINLEEMPPLPPLPPMQWRMGKPSLASERATEQRNSDHLPQMFPIKAATQPSNPFLPVSAAEYENSQSVMVGNMVHSSPMAISLPIPTMSSINSEHYTQPVNPFLEVRETYEERPQHSSLDEQGTKQPSVNPFSTRGTMADTSSTHASVSPQEELIQPLHQLPQEESSEKKIEQSPISDLTVVNPPISAIVPSPVIENEQPHYVPPTAGGGFMWSSSAAPFAPAIEDGKQNGNRLLKLMRPRSPLIDAVAAHDKSKLRKVTERVQPQIQKVDDRDSLLEQIRTKSFNLKPAVATRPSIQGPKTNLRVAAILEKANAIRQAFAGSDEDDDADSWSSD